ncbi:MAG: glutamine synthetase family protein, partial [Planktomarina sp.]|jgi:glutamine synthetase|nr:glutamine synthetase family protein [Planktomarina sp.]MDS9950083.1 glutamine synthetase family protein [Planktomarina sp.]|tara:strand:- start:121 stop:1401 length:1281 start_codon:yes stop_codon:yes gene_type:complete
MVNGEITRTRALFCDLLNLPRGKYLPPSVARSGTVGFARGAFAVSFDRDLLEVPGCGFYDGLPDMELVLDEERRKSWQSKTEIALGDLQVDDQPFGLCARSQLKRTVAEWANIGLSPKIGLETEAYLFQKDEDGVWRPYDTPGAFVYGTGPSNDPRGVMDEVWEMANHCNIPIESMNGEFDNGQFELTLKFDDPIRACDDAFLMRMMAREIALKKDLLITFLPKPIPDRGGSGLHVNFSFTDSTGQNVIAPDGSLSKVAQECIAGLIRHHEGLSGLLASTVNSYDRLNPASMAGYWANWAEDHRLVTTRTSTKSPKSARLEHRMADCATNPYLAVTAVLQAAKLGVIEKLPLPPAEDLDGMENTRASRHVPPSLDRAIDALDDDVQLRGAVGNLLCDALIFQKRDEFNRLKGKTVDQVRDFYLPFI